MVRRYIAFGLLFAALLLSACGLLNLPFASVFPVTATQTVARLDLSAYIPLEAAKAFRLSEVVSGSTKLTVLSSDFNFSGRNLFVMNENLGILQIMSFQELRAISSGFGGSYAMVEAGATAIVIGNIRFVIGSLGRLEVPAVNPMIPEGLSSPSFAESGSNIVNIRVNQDTNSLAYKIYPGDWSGFTTYEIPLGGIGPYELSSVFADPATGGYAVLVLHEKKSDPSSSDMYSIVRIPKSDFLSGLASPIINTYRTLSDSNLASDLFGFSLDGLVRYKKDRGDFLLFDIVNFADVPQATLHLWNAPTEVRTVYAIAGDYSFTFDSPSRIVTKLATWWPR